MKKICWFIGLAILFISSGCFDTVEEVTINDNGGGMFTSSSEAGKMLALVKAFAGEKEEMKGVELSKMKKDTLVNLRDIKDSVKNLSAAEIKILETGTLNIKIDVEEEIFSLKFSFPFSKPGDITEIRNVLKKSQQNILQDNMKKFVPSKDEDSSKKMEFFGQGLAVEESQDTDTGIDEYYSTLYEKKKLTRKVIKEKMAHVDDDKSLKSMKEMAQLGLSSNIKTVINLPRPAKKAEGRGIKLSDDRKKITIEGTLDDFLEDATYFEYEIEY